MLITRFDLSWLTFTFINFSSNQFNSFAGLLHFLFIFNWLPYKWYSPLAMPCDWVRTSWTNSNYEDVLRNWMALELLRSPEWWILWSTIFATMVIPSSCSSDIDIEHIDAISPIRIHNIYECMCYVSVMHHMCYWNMNALLMHWCVMHASMCYPWIQSL